MHHVTALFQSRRFGWWPVVVLGVAVALLVVASGVLALRAATELRLFRSVPSDNVMWGLAQLELELSTLQRAVAEGASDSAPETRAKIADAYAIYSRHLDMMLVSTKYRSFLDDVDALEPVENLARSAKDLRVLELGAVDATAITRRGSQAALDQSREILSRVAVDVASRVAQRDTAARGRVLELLRSLYLFPFLLLALLAGLGWFTYRLVAILRRQTVQARETMERLHTIVSTSRDAIVVTDARMHVIEFNAAAEALFGYPRGAALGTTLGSLVTDIGTPAMDGVVRGQGRRVDGDIVPLELTAASSGAVGRDVTVYVMRDIRNRLMIEEDLRDSRDRALAGERAKARFLAVMSHEMRTPLNGILGAISLMRAEADDPVMRRYIGILEGSGEILLSHINDVLDMSRIEAGGVPLARAVVDLDALSQGLISGLEPLARLGRVSLVRRAYFPGGAHVVTDPTRLRQILLNLLDNALKHSPLGEVALDLSLADTDTGAVLEIQVTDTGSGIATDQIDRIFEDFVQLGQADALPPEGSGLGLGITRRIVEAMGGSIGVDSEPGAGSLFWVRLPLHRAAPPGDGPCAPAATQSAEARPVPPQSVLVVEDNAVNRLIMREMLRWDGHQVDEAEDGRLGVAAARARRYDLILMDISMPVMDGVSAARQIRQGDGASAQSRIVALTAHLLAVDDPLLLAAGIDHVATKPLTWEGLRAILRGNSVVELRKDAPQPLLDTAVFATVLEAIGCTAIVPHLQRLHADGDALVATARAGAVMDAAAAHALAGAAATLGARRLHAVLSRIEAQPVDAAGVEMLATVWHDSVCAIDTAMTAAVAPLTAARPAGSLS